MTLDIHLKQGIGDITFDMPIERVVEILGKPDEVETIENALEETTTILRYTDTLTLFFEGDSPILSCIDIESEEATLFGRKIFDMGEKEIVKLMVAHQYFEQDVDTEDWGERRVSFNEGNIDFYLDNDDLLSAIIGK